jgi:hypothetical protein
MYVACLKKLPSSTKLMVVILKETDALKKNKEKHMCENDEVDHSKWTEVPRANLIATIHVIC